MILALLLAALGGDPQAPSADGGRWSVTLEPFVWLAGIDGHGSAESGPTTDIGEHVSLFGHLDGALMLAAEARAPQGGLAWLVNGLSLSLADDEGLVHTRTEAWMVELGAAFPVRATWDALAGVRVVDLEYRTEDGLGTRAADARWLDPWLGARASLPLGETWSARLRGDVGGFGVGTQLSLQGLAGLRAELGHGTSLDLGYRALSLDLDDDDLEYDALVHGPFLAFALHL